MIFDKQSYWTINTIKSMFVWAMLLMTAISSAQQKTQVDSLKKAGSRIVILDNQFGEYLQADSVAVHKLLGNVKLLHGSDTLFCDSAFFYTHRNSVEAFGDVVILQADGTEAYADYMRYTGNNRIVYMRSNSPLADVKLYDGKNNTLYSREIDYNLNTKIGRYSQRGFLETGATTLESNQGQYNLKTKDARFKGDVEVIDPEYKVSSSDLGYNTETEITRFLGPSVISNDKSILQTSSGTYDAKQRAARFVSRSSMFNEDQYIEGDTLDYNRNTGFGYARGNVISIDTAMKATLYCGYVQYNEQSRTMLAYEKPLMKKIDGVDSLFIKADTFYTAPDTREYKPPSAQDSLQQTVRDLRAAVNNGGTDSGQGETFVDTLDNTQQLLLTLPAIKDSLPVGLGDTIVGANLTTGNLINDIKDTVKRYTDTGAKEDAMPAGRDLKLVKKHMDSLVYKETDTSRGIVNDTSISEHKRALDDKALYYNNTPSRNADTGRSRYFIGYHNVLIYSDSLQGKCDSIRYAQADSTIRMYKSPLLWPQKSQLKGEMIFLKVDSSRLKEVYVPKNAIMISRSGPEKAKMFDQIQGGSIRCYLRNNKMDSLIAMPDASSIYFIRDDDSAYVGSSEAKSEKIEVWFVDDAINKIYYRKDVQQKTTPMVDVIPSELHLSRFSWDENLRPKTLIEFLNGTTLPHEPVFKTYSITESNATQSISEMPSQ